jgi:hypothetical protein
VRLWWFYSASAGGKALQVAVCRCRSTMVLYPSLDDLNADPVALAGLAAWLGCVLQWLG